MLSLADAVDELQYRHYVPVGIGYSGWLEDPGMDSKTKHIGRLSHHGEHQPCPVRSASLAMVAVPRSSVQ